MNTEEIKYFEYARKSTEGEDRQSLSIPGQLEDTNKIKEDLHLNVLETLTDSGSAKVPFNRPNYSAMIKRIKKGEANGIIVWKIDRLARNHLEGGELIHLLQTGIIRSIMTPGREYLSGDSALLISLEASMAAQYSVDLSQRVLKGMKKKAELGHPPMLARPGYLNSKSNIHGSNKIMVDPKRWNLVRKVHDLMLTGNYSMKRAAAVLNDEHNFRTRKRGKQNGQPLSIALLHKMLTDPFYTGNFYYKGKLYKGAYKPMISMDEHIKIKQILSRRGKQKPHKHEFAFTGFIKCGCCGASITASKKLRKTTTGYKSYLFYHCTKRKSDVVCTERHYTTELEMLSMVEAELKRIYLAPKWLEWAIEMARFELAGDTTKRYQALKTIVELEKKLLSELDSLVDLRLENSISEQQFLQKKAERDLKLISIREKRKRLESNDDYWLSIVSEKFNLVASAIEVLKSDDPIRIKKLCMSIGWNWILKEKKLTFSRHRWLEDTVVIKQEFTAENTRLERVDSFEEYRQTDSYKTAVKQLWSLIDHIRTSDN